jgi:hypothetical protein
VLADGLLNLPVTLKSLELEAQNEGDVPVVCPLLGTIDAFSTNLWHLTTRFEELRLENTAVPRDF